MSSYGVEMTVPRVLTAVSAALVLAAGLRVGPAAAALGPSPIRPHITFTMVDRFGLDADDNGLIDIPNTVGYVQNGTAARFDLQLLVGVDGIDATGHVGGAHEFRWEIEGPALESPLLFSTAYPELATALPEGEFLVRVATRVRLPWARLTVGTSTTITVNDVLVVALGDSYASGEGNPEVRRRDSFEARWADSPDAGAAQAHAEAHRSSLAWPARLALALEGADRATSVTFVSVAESGASIDRGLVGPQRTSPQVDQIRQLVGEREIDILLVQVGGNDIGFSHAVQALVEADPLFDPVCYGRLIDNVFASVSDGDWSRGVSLGYDAPLSVVCRPAVSDRGWEPLAGLEGLAEEFDRLAAALEGLSVRDVVLVGYPDPTGADGNGSICAEIVGDTSPPLGFHEIDRDEQVLGVERILEPLNDALAAAARAHGWRYVDGVAEAFSAGHGYCAPWPDYGASTGPGGAGRGQPSLSDPDRWFRNPGRFGGPVLVGGDGVTWYRTAAQSAVLQGPGARYMTTGTLHPNELGHESIARLVLAALREDDPPPPGRP